MFCPFCKEECRDDCTFHCAKISVGSTMTNSGITECLIVSKLDSINDCQSEQLNDILHKTKSNS